MDTNVLIAAFTTQGLCRLVFELCLNQHEVVINEEILGELKEKLHVKFKIPSTEVRETLLFLRKNVRLEPPAHLEKNVCRDPDDLPILGTAVSSKSDVVVTGDNDILVLTGIQGIPILSPREFWEHLRRT